MRRLIKYCLALIAISIIGFSIYFLVLKYKDSSQTKDNNEVYTCSMHPQIIRNGPGNCPICGMILVKKVTESTYESESSIANLVKPTDNFIVGNYQTTTALDTTLSGEVHLPGIVTFDPNSSVNIAARIGGRIERIYVNYKYQKVEKGQKLFDLYSPELLTEQQNYLYVVANDAQNEMIVNAAMQKLLLYGMTQNQIDELRNSKTANPIITIFCPVSGIVAETNAMEVKDNNAMQSSTNKTQEVLNMRQGDYIKKGEVVFQLLNTNKVWAVFNIIDGYNSFIKTNEAIKITTELDRNNAINAQINFIETQLNPKDKTNSIRVYLDNSNLKLPIGLRLQGIVKTTAQKGIWLQKESTVSIGNSRVVFIKMQNGFKATSIRTGIEIGSYIQIMGGITVKDTIAQNAQYLTDSESFIKTE